MLNLVLDVKFGIMNNHLQE